MICHLKLYVYMMSLCGKVWQGDTYCNRAHSRKHIGEDYVVTVKAPVFGTLNSESATFKPDLSEL